MYAVSTADCCAVRTEEPLQQQQSAVITAGCCEVRREEPLQQQLSAVSPAVNSSPAVVLCRKANAYE